MPDLYDIPTIRAAILAVSGKNVPESRLKRELDAPAWMPEVDRMIAVSNDADELLASTRYGLFIEMSNQRYKISSGVYKYARLLTPEEIAKCY